MLKGKLPIITGVCLGLGWPILNSLASESLSLLIGDTFRPVIPLLILLVFFEVGLKLLFWPVLAPITHISIAPQRVNPERWKPFAHEQLAQYTAELEQLGFTLLTDYTFTTSAQSQPSPATARLFVHPQKFVFAEIAQTENLPVSCSVSTFLESGWEMAVTNIAATNTLNAVSHAFMRQPRTLIRRRRGQSTGDLLQSLLSWRDQVCVDLSVEVLEEVDADAYFRKDANRRNRSRSRLLRSSMTWRLMEVVWFSLRPKQEWLGEYSPVV